MTEKKTRRKKKSGEAPSPKGAPEKIEPETGEDMLTVAQICAENGVDPKKGRAKLRKQNWTAEGGRYPKIERDSDKYQEVIDIIT